MPCFVGLFAVLAPRLVLFVVWLLSDYLGRAYHTVLWPILGFIFMPLTTLAYAWAVNSKGTVTGGYLVVVVIAALIDLGVIGGGSASRRRKARKS